jgi:hypothetical protein
VGLAGIQGTVPAPAALPLYGTFIGEAWISDSDGHLWVWKYPGGGY